MSQRGAYSPAVARTPAQRGKVGNWLVESRLARGWDTQEKARAEVARLTGWTIPQSVYAEWESGRRLPSEANLDRLRSFYGDAPEATETPDALVAALTAQTAAITALVGEMQKARQEVDPRLVAQILAFATQTGFLPREDDPDDPPAGSPSSNRRSQSRLEVVRPRTPRP